MVDGVSAVQKAHDLRIKLEVDKISAVTRAARTKGQPLRLQYNHAQAPSPGSPCLRYIQIENGTPVRMKLGTAMSLFLILFLRLCPDVEDSVGKRLRMTGIGRERAGGLYCKRNESGRKAPRLH